MSDPSRLELLRFTSRVSEQQATAALRQIDGWTAKEERRDAERRRGEKMRQPPPEWLLQHGLNPKNIDAVHTGDRWAVAGSDRCRPDTALGLLEWPSRGLLPDLPAQEPAT
ncbi:DUF6233 domain-containing protein [Streptomyces sp. JW3]|uniref:DUF6233 domain-containing protein n=1 Tax=Streptomyces sp. JW3 TaxID=3456955 RepID=UPI003FA4B90D